MRPWNAVRASSPVAETALSPLSTASAMTPAEPPGTAAHSAAVPELAAGSTAVAPDLTSVLDQIEQIRAIDPAAEQSLLAELRKAPPSSWPLVAEQFRASLAYRQQLLAADGQTHTAQSSFGTEPPNPFLERPRPTTTLPLGTPTAQHDGQLQSAIALPTTLSNAAPPNALPPSSTWPESPAPSAVAATITEPPAAIQNAQAASFNVIQASLDTPAAIESPTPTAGEPAGDAATDTEPETAKAEWQELVQQAADDLSRRAAASPTTTAEVHQHVSLRILRLLAGDTEGALEPIPRISPAEQDYWSKQLFALATYLDHHRQPDEKRRAAASVIHLDEAVSQLRELGALSVRNLTFCKTVYGYGAIEPYDSDRFSPGEQVSLYVEVENYHSKSTEKGYCTSLGSTYEIFNEAGVRMGGGEIPDVNDCCRSRRRDFHIQYALVLPQSLVPGRYQLQLVIKDRQSDKRGHATVAFEIKGAFSAAQPLIQ